LDSWAALKVFSKTLNETYLPAEGGDLEPIKNRSAELMLNAINVKASNIPKAIDSPVLRTNIDDLVKESNQLHKMIRKNMKDAVIKVKLFEVYQISQKIK
jgi:NifB/MoaA-like Fe-S oxidoreductase